MNSPDTRADADHHHRPACWRIWFRSTAVMDIPIRAGKARHEYTAMKLPRTRSLFTALVAFCAGIALACVVCFWVREQNVKAALKQTFAAQITKDVQVLEYLRTGITNMSIQLLEADLDVLIAGAEMALDGQSPRAPGDPLIKALQAAEQYRAVYRETEAHQKVMLCYSRISGGGGR